MASSRCGLARFEACDGKAGDALGAALALSEDTLLAGAPEDDSAGSNAGSLYVFPVPPLIATPACFGTACPCGNDDPRAGCVNSTGHGALLTACGTSTVAADDLRMVMTGLPANEIGAVIMGPAVMPMSFGDGTLCIGGGAVYRFAFWYTRSAGQIVEGPGIIAYSEFVFPIAGHIAAGQTWTFQGWYRDPAGPCSAGFNTSNAVTVTFVP